MSKIQSMFKIIPILGVFLISQIHCLSIQPFDTNALVVLESKMDTAVIGVEGNNIYLNPENIIINQDGLFLSTTEHVLLKLSSIFSNQLGLYTQLSESDTNLATVWPIIKCKNCGNYFAKTIFNKGICPVCGTMN